LTKYQTLAKYDVLISDGAARLENRQGKILVIIPTADEAKKILIINLNQNFW
jgi:hypothetical protein